MKDIISNLDWIISDGLIDFDEAQAIMNARVEDIISGKKPETIWLLEHPPLYTAGTSAKLADLLKPDQFPVYETGRGGQYTYHGPGQRIIYVMLDLNKRGRDIRKFITTLETWVVDALAEFNLKGQTYGDRVGIWIDRSHQLGTGREDKIGAIGVRLKKWVSFHGVSINVDPDISHFQGIVPCGISTETLGVTSLTDLGLPVSMVDLDLALKTTCPFLVAANG